MDVIFLDIDGVLNDEETYKTERGPEGYTGVDEKYIRNLKYLVNNTGAEIVLSSDWRDEWHHNGEHGADMKYLLAKLGKYGLTIKDKTPGHVKGKGFSGRGREIAEYLNSHPEVENYVILDVDIPTGKPVGFQRSMMSYDTLILCGLAKSPLRSPSIRKF